MDLLDEIGKVTGASSIIGDQLVQTLWSGYGQIRRYELAGGKYPSVIVKHINWPETADHPRGWNTQHAHHRKLKSYEVEKYWYQNYAQATGANCRVPELYHSLSIDSGLLLVMEDLDGSGFAERYGPETVALTQVKSVLEWLANFHAKFMGKSPEGLWGVGTYWHLETRPDEWKKMQNVALKEVAGAIDTRLSSASFQTFVHGDAKLANFCFGKNDQVAAVDFQYVGQGSGMKDVAYFLSSCFEEEECEQHEKELLDHYFEVLRGAISSRVDFEKLHQEWKQLYAFAWADFYRFLDGWSPGHWKMHRYSKRLTRDVMERLK